MDHPPKESTDSSILDELKKALVGADGCIELARRQRQQMEASSRALAAGGIHAETQLLEHARERREQLEALAPPVEMTPPEVPPPAPLPSPDPGLSAGQSLIQA